MKIYHLINALEKTNAGGVNMEDALTYMKNM